jgi:hypothetical protein
MLIRFIFTQNLCMRRTHGLLLGLIFLALAHRSDGAGSPRQYIELRVYHAADSVQLRSVIGYLQQAFVPSLHKQGIKKIGVFVAIDNDTATDKRVYVLVPYASWKEKEATAERLEKDPQYQKDGSDYINASYDKAPYKRYETILLRAFEMMPEVATPGLTGNKEERVYELRSYEGSTEKIYRNKVQMFNQGGETVIFKRLNFNPVFYGEVVYGSRMPNLMYMTSFENRTSREEHWKAFGNDPAWKELSSSPQYQHNVSKADITFLRPVAFSDL